MIFPPLTSRSSTFTEGKSRALWFRRGADEGPSRTPSDSDALAWRFILFAAPGLRRKPSREAAGRAAATAAMRSTLASSYAARSRPHRTSASRRSAPFPSSCAGSTPSGRRRPGSQDSVPVEVSQQASSTSRSATTAVSASSSPQREDWLRKTLACQPTVVALRGRPVVKRGRPCAVPAGSQSCLRRDQARPAPGPLWSGHGVRIACDLAARARCGRQSAAQDRTAAIETTAGATS